MYYLSTYLLIYLSTYLLIYLLIYLFITINNFEVHPYKQTDGLPQQHKQELPCPAHTAAEEWQPSQAGAHPADHPCSMHTCHRAAAHRITRCQCTGNAAAGADQHTRAGGWQQCARECAGCLADVRPVCAG